MESELEDVSESEGITKNIIESQHMSGKSKKNEPLISSDEQYQQSHKPFDFQQFLNHLKKKSADPIVRYIRSFLVSFSRQGHTFTSDQKIKIIRDFKEFMNDKFSLYEPFASMDDIDLENSREGLEKLIMNRLYEHCFPTRSGGTGAKLHTRINSRKIFKMMKISSRQLEKFNSD